MKRWIMLQHWVKKSVGCTVQQNTDLTNTSKGFKPVRTSGLHGVQTCVISHFELNSYCTQLWMDTRDLQRLQWIILLNCEATEDSARYPRHGSVDDHSNSCSVHSIGQSACWKCLTWEIYCMEAPRREMQIEKSWSISCLYTHSIIPLEILNSEELISTDSRRNT